MYKEIVENAIQQNSRNFLSLESKAMRQISDKLHDNLGQSLALMKLKLSKLSEDLSLTAHHTDVQDIIELVDNVIAFSRNFNNEIGIPLFYHLGFSSSLSAMTNDFAKKFGISILIKEQNFDNNISQELAIFIYRGLREMIVNTLKHANATKIEISINLDMALIKIDYRDNGANPIDKNYLCINLEYSKGLGLLSLKKKIQMLGGKFCIDDTGGINGAGSGFIWSIPRSIT